jgi:hypothetical protein
MLTSSALIAEARRRTGYDDLGEDSFREPMEKLIASISRENTPTEFGKVALPEVLLKGLTNRLKIEHWYKLHPEIDEQEIVAPVFGVGMPRTGSTFLTIMQGRDPATRSLRTWESDDPCPPPVPSDPSPQRIKEAQARLDMFKERLPLIFAMVPMGVDEPTECFDLMQNSFCNDYYYEYAKCSEFMDWFYDPKRDFSWGYQYHKRTLKLLQWRCPPKRWCLKMPSHSIMINGLAKVYPDARFIWTHREPHKVLPSIVRLVSLLREQYIEDPRTDLFAGYQVWLWSTNMKRLEDFRNQHEDRFFDVHHAVLMKQPFEELKRLYEWLGWEMTPAFAENMERWIKANPRQEYKSPAKFELDQDDIRKRFDFYYKRYYPNA